jgi:diadenosine tetraphosphate (Ap4A) HIT family hydrolase
MNQTIEKFGYPGTLLKEYDHWVVLLRPAQATLGALILACKDEANRFSDITPEAFTEMGRAVTDIERGLASLFDYRKLNYLMLMMVDPDVHYHVLPRYESDQTYGQATFTDPGWPGPPNVAHDNEADAVTKAKLIEALKAALAWHQLPGPLEHHLNPIRAARAQALGGHVEHDLRARQGDVFSFQLRIFGQDQHIRIPLVLDHPALAFDGLFAVDDDQERGRTPGDDPRRIVQRAMQVGLIRAEFPLRRDQLEVSGEMQHLAAIRLFPGPVGPDYYGFFIRWHVRIPDRAHARRLFCPRRQHQWRYRPSRQKRRQNNQH